MKIVLAGKSLKSHKRLILEGLKEKEEGGFDEEPASITD